MGDCGGARRLHVWAVKTLLCIVPPSTVGEGEKVSSSAKKCFHRKSVQATSRQQQNFCNTTGDLLTIHQNAMGTCGDMTNTSTTTSPSSTDGSATNYTTVMIRAFTMITMITESY